MEDATEKIRILIADDIPETRENLRKLLYFETDIEIVGEAADGRAAIQEAQKLTPDIVLMDINMPDMDGISASQEISRVAPRCQVIMMSVQSEADYLRRSMLAGAMDFLTKPFSGEELSSSIHRVYDMGASRRTALPTHIVAAEGTPGSPEAPSRGPSSGSKLLMIYSPKGGTGCSTVATNLAIALQQVTSKRVALVDANLQFGDVDVLLNLQGHRSIADAASQVDDLDSVLLSALVAPHPSGIRVLAAPPAPEMADTIHADEVKRVLTAMLQEFDLIVVDTASTLDDIVLAIMDLAERMLIVMTPEIPSIKSTTQFFELAEALEFPPEQIDLILNRVIPRDGIRAEQLERSMKHEILAQLDFDAKGCRAATNQGLPLLVSEPKHPISDQILALARQVVANLEPQPVAEPVEESAPGRPEPKRRSGLFGRLKR